MKPRVLGKLRGTTETTNSSLQGDLRQSLSAGGESGPFRGFG